MASPWGRKPSWWIWFAIFSIGLTALLVLLAANSGVLPNNPESGSHIIHSVVLAALIAAGLVHGRSIGFKGALGAICAWTAIGALVVLGYSYRFEFQEAWQRVAGEIVPADTIRTGPRSFAVRRADNGHFYIWGQVNGTSIRFLVDTGASMTMLGPRDAARISIDPARLSFTQRFRTANGLVWGAPVTLPSLTIGSVRFRDVRASVNKVPLGGPLLGVSTLKLFKGWKVEKDRLTVFY